MTLIFDELPSDQNLNTSLHYNICFINIASAQIVYQNLAALKDINNQIIFTNYLHNKTKKTCINLTITHLILFINFWFNIRFYLKIIEHFTHYLYVNIQPHHFIQNKYV